MTRNLEPVTRNERTNPTFQYVNAPGRRLIITSGILKTPFLWVIVPFINYSNYESEGLGQSDFQALVAIFFVDTPATM